jgi:hypothetical protein
MKIGEESVNSGPSEVVLTIIKAEKAQTSKGDEALWLTFVTAQKKEMRSSYPFGRGPQGKLYQFLKGARGVLKLEKAAEVDIDELLNKPIVCERREREFAGADGKDVYYWYFIPVRWAEEGEAAAAETKKDDVPQTEVEKKEAVLIQKLIASNEAGGLSKEQVYEGGKELGMSISEIDMFMIRRATKSHILKEGEKYKWV